jgi:predicted alternative tryptophan synthase beta-subunit
MRQTKIVLSDKEIPTKWYNIMADMPNKPKPPLHPGTHQPIGPQDLTPIFPMALIEQEVSAERWIDIPEEVLDIYSLWRPSPLYRAHRLEKALGTPAKIYYKYEGVSPAGSHKPNTAIPQAFYNKKAGIKRIATETGAGQWGASGARRQLDLTTVHGEVSGRNLIEIQMERGALRASPSAHELKEGLNDPHHPVSRPRHLRSRGRRRDLMTPTMPWARC